MNRFLALLIGVHSVLMVSGQDRDSLRKMLAFANEDTGKVKILNVLGYSYAWSDADTSIMYAQQAMDLAEKIHFEHGVVRAQLTMSAALTTIGNYYRALDNGFKALTYLEKTSDKINTAFANQLIAGCYRDMGDYSNSLQYYYRALKLAENNPYGTAMVSGLLGAVYQRNDQPDSAIFFLSKGV